MRTRVQSARSFLHDRASRRLQLVWRRSNLEWKIAVPDLNNRTDEELAKLSASEVGRRKIAVAQEILKRRRQERWQQWLDRHGALAGVIRAVMGSR